jgi:GTP cyclohydrolase IA
MKPSLGDTSNMVVLEGDGCSTIVLNSPISLDVLVSDTTPTMNSSSTQCATITTISSSSCNSSNSDSNIAMTSSFAATATTNMAVPSTKTTPNCNSNNNIRTCPIRASGQVCICDLCEAARLRLLHRLNRMDTSTTAVSAPTVIATNSHPKTMENDQPGMESHPHSTATGVVTVVSKKRSRGDNEYLEDLDADVYNTSNIDLDGATTQVNEHDTDPEHVKLRIMSQACRTILQCIGEDPDREGLQKTPERWAKALLFLCHGYHMTPNQITNNAIFCENHNEMVVVRNIDIHSLCEHHMVPFTGHVHIGYVPNGKIIGLSKLARLADLFARRLQVQERLTRQIADAIVETIEPLGVAVVIECTHFCMVMRGIQKTGAITTTSSVRGCFETNSKTRAEFFSILHGGGK